MKIHLNPSSTRTWVRTNGARTNWAVWAGVSLAVLAGVGWIGPRLLQTEGSNTSATHSDGWSMLRSTSDAKPSGAPAADESSTRSIASIRAAVFSDALLSQTQSAGDWSVDSKGKLQPSLALRQRFEHYLLALGTVSNAEMRALIEDEARRAVGEKSAAEIMAIFDKYWALRNHQPTNRLVMSERDTWEPAFQELKGLRRQYLGAEWAEAFFKDEEAEFVRFTAQADGKAGPDKVDVMNMPVPQVGPGKDTVAVHAERVSLYGEAAAQRLAKADAEWAEWEARLAGAKNEWQRLQASAELSDVQRQQAIDQYIQSHIPADERTRVRGLLN